MNIDIAALKQAAQAATPGAWRDGGNRQVCIDDPSGRIIGVIGELWSGTVGIGQADANMAHICAARPEVVLELIARLERAEAGAFGGYVIQHADGDRWRTLDSIGMPDWTDDEGEALRFALRKHADAWAGEDPEDVRIALASVPARPEASAASERGAGLMLAAAVHQSGGRIAISAATLLRAHELTMTRVDRPDIGAGAIEFLTSDAQVTA